MATTDCEELHARADMLHQEADLGRSKARSHGAMWSGYVDQIGIAVRCEAMALRVEAKIAEDC